MEIWVHMQQFKAWGYWTSTYATRNQAQVRDKKYPGLTDRVHWQYNDTTFSFTASPLWTSIWFIKDQISAPQLGIPDLRPGKITKTDMRRMWTRFSGCVRVIVNGHPPPAREAGWTLLSRRPRLHLVHNVGSPSSGTRSPCRPSSWKRVMESGGWGRSPVAHSIRVGTM